MCTVSKSISLKPIFLLLVVLILPSCGGGSSESDDAGEPVVNTVTAEVAGYYTGTAAVKEADNSTDLSIDDLTVFVHGSRIMAMGRLSDPVNFVLYDIAISSITGDSFEAVATIYKAAVNIGTTNVTGTIDAGTGLTGTFEGSGIANGSFSVMLDMDINAQIADIEDIEGFRYDGGLNSGLTNFRFEFFTDGETISSQDSTDAVQLSGCDLISGSTLTAITEENLYVVDFIFTGCDDVTVDGTYTGLASTFDDLDQLTDDGLMPIAFSNGSFAGTAIFGR